MGTDLLRVESNERVDLNDFEHLADDGLQANLRQLGDQFFTDPLKSERAFILDGFLISNPVGEQVEVTLGRAILGQREGGQIFQGVLTSEGVASRIVDVAGYANGTYGVYIRFEYVEGETSSRAFWNPQGNGSEFAQTIPTRRLANWSMRIELASPGAEWMYLSRVDVTGGVITGGPDDRRHLYFEGPVSGGGASYASGWSSDGGTFGSANDRNADRSTYGVKDLQTFTRAMRQCIEDIKGRGIQRWWDREIGGMNIGFDADPIEDELAIGDADFAFEWQSATVVNFHFDRSNNDRLEYIRSTNQWIWKIGGVTEAVLETDLATFYGDVNINSGGLAVGYVADEVAILNDRIYLGDSTFFLINTGGGFPGIFFDSNDVLRYDRSDDEFQFSIGGADRTVIMEEGINVTGGMSVGFTNTPVADTVAVGDATFLLNYNSGNPQISFHSTDFLRYERANNRFIFGVGSAGLVEIDDGVTGAVQAVIDITPPSTTPARGAMFLGSSGNDDPTSGSSGELWNRNQSGSNHRFLSWQSVSSGVASRQYIAPIRYVLEVDSDNNTAAAYFLFQRSASNITYLVRPGSLREGSVIKIRAGGEWTKLGANSTVGIRLLFGGQSAFTATHSFVASGFWTLDAEITIRSLSTPSAVPFITSGVISFDDFTSQTFKPQSFGPLSFDHTINASLGIQGQIGGGGGNYTQMTAFIVEIQ